MSWAGSSSDTSSATRGLYLDAARLKSFSTTVSNGAHSSVTAVLSGKHQSRPPPRRLFEAGGL